MLMTVIVVMVSRSTLMTGNRAEPTVNPWVVNETEETRGLSFGEIRQQQQQIVEGVLHTRLWTFTSWYSLMF